MKRLFWNCKNCEWSHSPNNKFKYTVNSIKKVINNANLIEYSKSLLTFVKGLIEDTTKTLNVKKIAILHLDSDLYQSTSSAINNLWDKIEVGGIVIIDDYSENQNSKNDTFPGVWKAIDEFRNSNKEHIYKVSLRGTPFLVRTK